MVDWAYWNPFKPWARPRAEVIRTLEQMLDGTFDSRKWDNFVNIPMKADPELEAVRRTCGELEDECFDSESNFVLSGKARKEIKRLLLSISK